MRRLTLGALALLVACGGGKDATTAPRESFSGFYRLESINGRALPFAFPPDSSKGPTDTTITTTRIISEDVRLDANGHAEDEMSGSDAVRFLPGSGAGDFPWVDYYKGRWEDAGTRVRFIADELLDIDGNTTVLAPPDTFYFNRGATAGELVFTQQSYTWVYRRQ